jgi:hypothetical protein
LTQQQEAIQHLFQQKKYKETFLDVIYYDKCCTILFN